MIAKKGTGYLVEYLHRRADSDGTPLSGAFELTPVCNMRCKMCYVRKEPEELKKAGKTLLSVEQWMLLAEQMKEQGTLFLLLTGGEPFTYPGFHDLYCKLKKMGFVISINTNGTMIDEKTADWLACDPPHRVNITVYGASDDTYLRLCHNPNGFTKAKRAIELLQERGINVKLNCSLTPENVSDLEKIVEYSDERKLVLQATSYMFPPVRRDANSVGRNQRFSPEDCAYVESRIRYLQRGADNLKDYCDGIEKLQPVIEDDIFDCEGDHIRCRAGKSAYWITWDGRMLMCAMTDEPGFDPFKDGFSGAWQQLRHSVKEVHLPSVCAVCEAKDNCHSCAAIVYTETGSYSEKPQYRCEMFRAIPDACHRILEEEKYKYE